jgi:cysteine-rich repeat protein
MENTTKPLIILLLCISATALAQSFPTSHGTANTKSFINNTTTIQSRQGWIGIGNGVSNTTGPLGTVEVRSADNTLITVSDTLKVLGNTFIATKAAIGGTLPTTNGLKVSNGTIRVSPLGGYGKKRICMKSDGVLERCSNTETLPTDLCTNITGEQSALPYTYYEEVTGSKVIVNDPNNDGICTRIGSPCSDGIDNDGDGFIDTNDGNCYDNVVGGGTSTAPNGYTVVNKQSAPLSGSTAAINAFVSKIGTPTIKIGDRYFKYNPTKTFPTGLEESSSTVQTCGNGIVESPEVCDDGNTSNTDTCNNSCQKTYCGDAIYQAPNGNGQTEQCDDGNGSNTDQCATSCNKTSCGDGIVQSPNGYGQNEQCDGGAGCSSSCTTQVCGNGVIEGSEQCDNGSDNANTGGASCSTSCITRVVVTGSWMAHLGYSVSGPSGGSYEAVQGGVTLSAPVSSTTTIPIFGSWSNWSGGTGWGVSGGSEIVNVTVNAGQSSGVSAVKASLNATPTVGGGATTYYNGGACVRSGSPIQPEYFSSWGSYTSTTYGVVDTWDWNSSGSSYLATGLQCLTGFY